MPAYSVDKSDLQGTSLLIWESIKKSLTNNMKYYNFGGTHMEQKSLYNFKKGWGTDDFNYNYYVYGDFNKINELDKNLLKESFENFYVYNYDKLSK
jgi:lipid II:glycine glycyltransferase (peptidoglycan interpeptide bridge formation enzyme)